MHETHLARARPFTMLLLAAAAFSIGAPAAQAPGEVAGVSFGDPSTLTWTAVPGADSYNVYRVGLADQAAGAAGRCHGSGIESTEFDTPAGPGAGQGYAYLVTAESAVDGEGTPGLGSSGSTRHLLGSCSSVMQTHVLDRTGYGWSEWSRDRIETLGLGGYIEDQLDPRFIDESTNDDLTSRLGPIDPPADIIQVIQQQVIRATYARRQLEQQVATFWANHFNTDWAKIAELYLGAFPPCEAPGVPVQCDEDFPARAYLEASMNQYREMSDFRSMGFGGSFREMVQASTLSPAMIIYLDTFLSVAGAPNENYPRELMELHTMGVDGGYTQQDVEQLSRIITGWTLCKKADANVDDPLAPCLPYWEDDPPGRIVATFLEGSHDCGGKILFENTPQEITIAETCGDPAAGVQELFTALDAIGAHPSTVRFISGKILERFVTDEPDQAMVDALVDVWNDGGNPNGVGDLQAVLAAALSLDAFLDPDRVHSKIKTPLEHFVSALRATRGRTDGATAVINYLVSAQHIPHYNPVPTGWPEDGASWIGTNNTLDRQNFGFVLLLSPSPLFGAEPIDLLNDNGVSTAPGNAETIVDFLAEILFGGALTPAERQAAVDYLNTDDLGHPGPYDDQRIREVVAVLLGYPQFQEQ